MKQIKIVAVLCILFLSSSIGAIQADIILKRYSNLTENYIDLYTYILNPAASLDSMSTRRLESLVVIRNEENIAVAEKYLYQVSANEQSDILDLKRYGLSPGNYSIRVEIIDLDDASNYFSHSEEIAIEANTNLFSQSDLLLGFQSEQQNESLKKMNVSLEPMVFDFCRNKEQLILYTEFYNADLKDGELFIGYNILHADTTQGERIVKKKFSKLANEAFIPQLTVIPIDDLLSNAYIARVEVFDRDKNVLISRQIRFDVSNAAFDVEYELSYNKDFENSWVQDMDRQELEYGIKAIFPQLKNSETEIYNFVLDSKDLSVLKYFLYKFWSERSAEFPEEVYKKYMKVAEAVDNSYRNNVGKGFETDRGYIFLKYGKPNDIIAVEDEPSAPPYEIWVFSYIAETQQTDVKFLFFNESLVSNDFKLLHSTCRGELNNPRWEITLYGDDPNVTQQNSIDARKAPDGYNRRAREYFSDF